MKILVGMSGGVDSSVAALLLKDAGHEVIGITMSIWGKSGTEKQSHKNACYGPNEKEDIEETKNVCRQIGIPFYAFDCADSYERIVLENFREEYLSGRTPNPCVWCNSLVKFGVLPALAGESGLLYDKFATGHYARIVHDAGRGLYYLKRAVDLKKDQTYFLYRLNQEQLARTLFPLGGLTKEEVRGLARSRGLRVHDKEESQDFYSDDYNQLLCVPSREGKIVDIKGNVLGLHQGIWNFTIGQRKGIGVSGRQPLYVIELKKDRNEVVVGTKQETYDQSLIATHINWLSGPLPEAGIALSAKIRSAQNPKECLIKQINEKEIHVDFKEPQSAITPGQSIVLYDGDAVLGGGIIDRVIRNQPTG